MEYYTREAWLQAAVKQIDEKIFQPLGYDVPAKIAIACGFPKGKALGQCWCPSHTQDDTTHIFISPRQGDPVEVLSTVVHEMVHAILGIKAGHGKKFNSLAAEVGLEGKGTQAAAREDSPLWLKLSSINEALGDYPHSVIGKSSLGGGDGDGEGKTRKKWPTYISNKVPDYKVKIRPALLEEHGPPRDPWGNEMRDIEAE